MNCGKLSDSAKKTINHIPPYIGVYSESIAHVDFAKKVLPVHIFYPFCSRVIHSVHADRIQGLNLYLYGPADGLPPRIGRSIGVTGVIHIIHSPY